MNDVELTLRKIDEIIEESSRTDLSFAEKSGLFSAISVITKNIDDYIEEKGGEGYASFGM